MLGLGPLWPVALTPTLRICFTWRPISICLHATIVYIYQVNDALLMIFHYALVAKKVIHEKQRISSAARFYDRCVQEYDRAYREPCAVHFQELNDL